MIRIGIWPLIRELDHVGQMANGSHFKLALAHPIKPTGRPDVALEALKGAAHLVNCDVGHTLKVCILENPVIHVTPDLSPSRYYCGQVSGEWENVMLYDPGRDRTMIGTKVIAQSQTGDSLKGDQPEGVQACNQKQLKCHWELNDAGALEMIWSIR